VPIKPHPLEAEIINLREENIQLKQQLTTLQTATEENKLLKAQLEVLREVVKSR
jgi:cell shape-determining protein MreC